MVENSLSYCSPETNLAKATKMMKDSNLGALPVVDKDQKVIGIITDRDICLSLANKGKKTISELSVKEMLSTWREEFATLLGDSFDAKRTDSILSKFDIACFSFLGNLLFKYSILDLNS